MNKKRSAGEKEGFFSSSPAQSDGPSFSKAPHLSVRAASRAGDLVSITRSSCPVDDTARRDMEGICHLEL